tara:strand:+ start:2595 stop:3356 length:762 start_codon:yes stop_codon:yes gene_type:complete
MRCVLIAAILLTGSASAQDNSSGTVSGDFNSNSGNREAVIESNNLSETYQNTYNGPGSSPGSQPVPTANAPTVMGGGGTDSCLMPSSSGIQVSVFGFSTGKMVQDAECNRRKDARLMGQPQPHGLGLQISGLSVMCASPQVFKAMAMSSTPCPIYNITTGRILTGRPAYEAMRGNPSIYVVGYEKDLAFWNAFLRMDLKELPNVETKNNVGPSLSDRFRAKGAADVGSSGATGCGGDNPATSGAERASSVCGN